MYVIYKKKYNKYFYYLKNLELLKDTKRFSYLIYPNSVIFLTIIYFLLT